MAVIATGFFDGVHLGHRHVINALVSAARQRGEESIVVTFWPHPRNVLQDDARNLRLLTSLEEKKTLLKACGVDRVEVIRFTKDFSSLTTEQYFKDVLIARYGATAVVLGYDNRMGCNPGTPEEIAGTARQCGLDVVHPGSFSLENGLTVSSTKIRDALLAGNTPLASEMLGHPYSLHGVVVAGNRLGRTIGFPTANMQLYEPLKLVPANGVYLVDVEMDGRSYSGMCNIGVRPTVGASNSRTIETNIFDFNEDIYGLDLTLYFRRKIRDERKFGSLDELKLQLEKDRADCLDLA